jgi:hypothetical protein
MQHMPASLHTPPPHGVPEGAGPVGMQYCAPPSHAVCPISQIPGGAHVAPPVHELPPVHTYAPPTKPHVAPPVHALPQLPQFAPERRSASQPFAGLPSQLAKSGLQVNPHVLPLQLAVALAGVGHGVQLAPHVAGSLSDTQPAPQRW